MTVIADSAAPRVDRDNAEHRRGFGAAFWAAMVFALACLMAAGMVAIFYGVFGRPAPSPHPPERIAPAVSNFPLPAAAATTETAALPQTLPPAGKIDVLDARVRRLESSQARTLDAAVSMLAAAALSDAAAGPHPFINELAAIERLMPNSRHVRALATIATQGAPTRVALAGELGDIAARVSVAAHAPAKNAGFMTQLGYLFSRVVSIRRVDTLGGGSDAILARAQRTAADGDLEQAITLLNGLPSSARSELGDWRERAQRRVDIDGHIAGLRAQALSDLAAATGAPA